MVWFIFREDYYVAAREPKRPSQTDDGKIHDTHAAWAAEMEQVFGLAELIVAKQRARAPRARYGCASSPRSPAFPIWPRASRIPPTTRHAMVTGQGPHSNTPPMVISPPPPRIVMVAARAGRFAGDRRGLGQRLIAGERDVDAHILVGEARACTHRGKAALAAHGQLANRVGQADRARGPGRLHDVGAADEQRLPAQPRREGAGEFAREPGRRDIRRLERLDAQVERRGSRMSRSGDGGRQVGRLVLTGGGGRRGGIRTGRQQ